MEPKTGDKAVCSMCSNEIEYTGQYWDHTGPYCPRHPATPQGQSAAPIQPNWTKELDAREWSQVLHAQDYAQNHQAAGAPGHGQFVLIAKLAALLDRPWPLPEKTIKVVWDDKSRCWRDIVTGVKVDA
jgi:hypothetical protein